MTTLLRRTAALPRIPLAVLGLTLAVVLVPRLVGAVAPQGRETTGDAAGLATAPSAAVVPDDDPVAGSDAGTTGAGGAGAGLTDPLAPPAAAAGDDDLARIRSNITFWGDRLADNPRDFVSATRLAGSSIELARATGDISAYVAADHAVDQALSANPDAAAAQGLRGSILVALHRFPAARDHARTVLADAPDDPVALATLGDASLELGDLATARESFRHLDAVADSAAAKVRLGRLAFIEGRTKDAVRVARAAVTAALDEGALGSALAWYHYQLGEMLLATSDRAGAAGAFDDALAADPHLPLALGGRARLAAADGRLDAAIADLDLAVATVPLPELLARRADLYDLRAATGDERRARDDRATILAIAQLSGEAAGVYDRTLSLYLATTGIDAPKALRLAEEEITVRKDVYGYDALGWAYLANGQATEADAALTTALAVGTRDAKVLYHAGMAAAAVGDGARAHGLLEASLALDPTFDPVSVARARATLTTLR